LERKLLQDMLGGVGIVEMAKQGPTVSAIVVSGIRIQQQEDVVQASQGTDWKATAGDHPPRRCEVYSLPT